MAKTTTNLGLIKPERSDNYSVDVMGNNMDIIDAKITALEAGEFESVTGNDVVVTGRLIIPYNADGLTLYTGSGASGTKKNFSGWVDVATLSFTNYPKYLYVANAECTVTISVSSTQTVGGSPSMGVRLLHGDEVIATKTVTYSGNTSSTTAVVSPYNTYTLQVYSSSSVAVNVTGSVSALYLKA